ncbi:MAG TPA: alpha/beta hydrolase family protein, partial [Limnochordia bacterium]|nr:alpha/beta hydrolase family protein [Limnochordia bacterium]
RGFVCLCPDHLAAGERLDPRGEPYDTAPFYVRHPDWSAVGKAIWDGARALDILQSLEVVDGSRLGVAGHSLGGHGSLFLAAMDERVKAAVCNCGLTLFAENPKRLAWSRDSWYRYFPRLRPLFLANTGLPFDLHEIAALIAPRAFLNISALADEGFAGNELLGEAGIELNKVWQLHGEGDRFGWFMFGGPHSVPHAARQLAAAWLEQWLQPGQ